MATVLGYCDEFLMDLWLVNWDCVLRTTTSDIAVDYVEIKDRIFFKVPGYGKPVEFGVLTSFAYPLEGNLGEIVVATTRVETMLFIFMENLPTSIFNERKLPIICDAILVDLKFGTGAVKLACTLLHPACDPNDFEIGKRHNLDFINIFTNDRKINSNGGMDFAGMTAALQEKVLATF
ncbi:unnamed protein product [Ilex paraguariensis]|uniref:valine--tRNA ligase n=1 Tax=Ilex paraguariensis TaxID=185542 RepID=A0ABC8SUY4_9AQUA